MSDFINNKTQKADDSPPPHENLQIVQLRLLSEQGEAVKEKNWAGFRGEPSIASWFGN